MPFDGAFTIAATAGVPGSVTLTDTSTGSDSNLTGRTITMYGADGSVFYTGTWAIGDTTKEIVLLTYDKALNVKVDWASSDELESSTYTYSKLFASVVFLLEQFSMLTRLQASNPIKMRDRDFYAKKMELLVEIKGAEYGIDLMEDIIAAHECIERGRVLVTNKALFY